MLINLEEGLTSFHTSNLGSVGQRAAKLSAVQVGGLKKSLPPGLGPSQTSRPGFDSDRIQIILKV